jgi:purine-binding chemotaxis protein CheW
MATVSTRDYYLSFALGRELFAIQVNDVLEVLPMQDITPVPKTNTSVLGIVNFRGEILPVIDFKKKLKIKPVTNAKTVIVVLEVEMKPANVLIGILVDGVNDVFEITLKEIKQIPEIGMKFKAEFLSGIYKSGERFISLLDIHKVFSREEILNMDSKVGENK